MRCYNGCPDSALKAVLDSQEAAQKRLAQRGLRATYFPMEGKWKVFNSKYIAVTGFHDTVEEAEAAIN